MTKQETACYRYDRSENKAEHYRRKILVPLLNNCHICNTLFQTFSFTGIPWAKFLFRVVNVFSPG